MTTPLAALAKIITDGVGTLEGAYAKEGVSFPSLDEPFKPSAVGDSLPLMLTARQIVAAAEQIIAMVTPPMEHLQLTAGSFYFSAMLDVANQTNLANILSAAGPQGLHAKDISAKAGVETSHIARTLRFLASRHIFKEVSPNVFAINKLSSLLVKQALVKDPQADPISQYDDSPPAAWVGHVTDEALKSAPYISSYILGQHKEAEAPFNLAFKTSSSVWELYEQPEHLLRGRRFVHAMKGRDERFPAVIYTSAIDWASLGPNDVAVDVGGGAGRVTLNLHKAFPNVKFIVQDLEKTIAEAKPFWETEAPNALTSGKVELQVQDFFKPQAVKGSAVYFMRYILHDWSQAKAIEILKNLREAAGPNTKLVVFDMIVPYACASSAPPPPGVPPTPFPLLSNYLLGSVTTVVDIQMLNLLNGMERTIDDFEALGKASGWKLESVKPGVLAALIYVPA